MNHLIGKISLNKISSCGLEDKLKAYLTQWNLKQLNHQHSAL